MLESILTEKKEPTGNIMIIGDPFCGKKKVIEMLQEQVGINKQNSEKFLDLEKVYIMDFKYLQLRKAGEEESEDGGKINFYVVNKKYEYMKQFFSKEMFKNLLIVICLDLNKPDQLVKSFIEWHEYIMKIMKEFLEEMDFQSR